MMEEERRTRVLVHCFTFHCLHMPTRPEMYKLDSFPEISAQSFAVKYLHSDSEYDGGIMECVVHPRSERECERSTIMGLARLGHASVSQHGAFIVFSITRLLLWADSQMILEENYGLTTSHTGSGGWESPDLWCKRLTSAAYGGR
jgi:hypothetical protein